MNSAKVFVCTRKRGSRGGDFDILQDRSVTPSKIGAVGRGCQCRIVLDTILTEIVFYVVVVSVGAED